MFCDTGPPPDDTFLAQQSCPACQLVTRQFVIFIAWYLPLIGLEWSRDQDDGLSLVIVYNIGGSSIISATITIT